MKKIEHVEDYVTRSIKHHKAKLAGCNENLTAFVNCNEGCSIQFHLGDDNKIFLYDVTDLRSKQDMTETATNGDQSMAPWKGKLFVGDGVMNLKVRSTADCVAILKSDGSFFVG